jgi:2-polyprenyl-3-methyl-5-hydroxy-6-metoxy-1,4-benzoquinol methylase
MLDGIPRDGDLLDIGCANGLLLESLVCWAAERGITLTPHGLDFVTELVEIARQRFPEAKAHFHIGNAFDWQPARRYDFVYTLLEYVPKELLSPYLQRLLDDVIAPGGRLIVSSYGNRSRNERSLDVDLHLQMLGFQTSGCSNGREDDGWVATRVAWIDR